MIHNILILKKTGELIYSKSFGTEKWDDILTCGFISATFSFTENIFGASIHDIGLGPYQILFESLKNGELIIIAFIDKNDSIISIRKTLIELRDEISANC